MEGYIDLSKGLETLRVDCPTCGLRNNEQRICRRCGSDLSLLFQTAASALALRNQARRFIHQGQFPQALHLLNHAEGLHRTKLGTLIIQILERAMQTGNSR